MVVLPGLRVNDVWSFGASIVYIGVWELVVVGFSVG